MYGINISAECSFVLSQSTRVTDVNYVSKDRASIAASRGKMYNVCVSAWVAIPRDWRAWRRAQRATDVRLARLWLVLFNFCDILLICIEANFVREWTCTDSDKSLIVYDNGPDAAAQLIVFRQSTPNPCSSCLEQKRDRPTWVHFALTGEIFSQL